MHRLAFIYYPLGLTQMTDLPCPCHSGLAYVDCCQPLHHGLIATTPEALMRSRYCAFALRLSDYLLQSWHPSTRPEQLDLQGSPDWKSLQIITTDQKDARGRVHFRALYQTGKRWGFLEEESDFVFEAGHWYYLSGQPREGQIKPGRNDPCPCGSGRKFKLCCGSG